MGRHEIRLRRRQMTSRRIARHKNYAGLIAQHRKSQRTRTIIRWVVYVLIFLMSMMLIYYAVDKVPDRNSKKTGEIKTTLEFPKTPAG